MSDYVVLSAGDTQLRLKCKPGEPPEWRYFGPNLPGDYTETVINMHTRQHAPGSPDREVAASLLNGMGAGWAGPPGFAAHRGGQDWASRFVLRAAQQDAPNQVQLITEDNNTQVAATHRLTLNTDSEVVTVETEIENFGDHALSLDWCSVLCIPVDARFTRLLGFAGRWANEFQTETIDAFHGTYLRENRAGRTSHDSFPGLILTQPSTSQTHGHCMGFHLGWSGNHSLRLDRLSDGRAQFMAGEYFWPGEMQLMPGARYTTPRLYIGQSQMGLNGLSHKFHTHVRSDIIQEQVRRQPRPVHFNTWEAVYFDHDETALMALADSAADLGVERFVLDDGWFGLRRNDRAGLGDWYVSPDVYPNGLAPLIAHVKATGMEFGLWVEPEMVNPDSDLFRAHPDWVLAADGLDQIPSRGQYVLDLTRSEVGAYIYERLDALLTEYDIGYLKWDMNRNLHHPGSRGFPAAHSQVQHVYAMLDRLRARHPEVEIESCASGGGRADYGILSRTDRIWTSDSNDALDRQRIQRGASYFFPLEVLGAHIGPHSCHITGRKLSIDVRAATALFGHMGLELDVRSVSEADREKVKAAIALYKANRDVLHSGRVYRLDTPTESLAMGVVSEDARKALYSWCQIATAPNSLPGRFYPVGLDGAAHYSIRLIWPDPFAPISTPSVIDALDLTGAGAIISGARLMEEGLQLPLTLPDTCLIYGFDAV